MAFMPAQNLISNIAGIPVVGAVVRVLEILSLVVLVLIIPSKERRPTL